MSDFYCEHPRNCHGADPGIGGGHYQCSFCKKIERLTAENDKLCQFLENGGNYRRKAQEHDEPDIEAYENKIEELRRQVDEPSFNEYVEITKNWLRMYPPGVFTGVSGDPGPLFVVAVREALENLEPASTRPCQDLGKDGHNHPANPCSKCNGTGEIRD